ncbi:hypothetical protein [Minwuia thermotolerans]|uniref:Uncharacterized protein n=1 Tax=Minwuia thermotolerans TaxID=2056226 RepID=A0A2M9G0B8_9PROT|nr:hypothetical protein [Minwuia thermotolerans]PJK29160.1 hypothetical protein CVT23_13285 [Minwuia thermotolerans]
MTGDADNRGGRSGSVWTIRGVESEIQEAARLAARQSGQTLAEWLSRVIGAAALAELDGTAEDATAAAAADMADFRVLLDERTRDFLNRNATSTGSPDPDVSGDEPMTAVVELDDPAPSGGLSPEMQEEFDRLRLLIHEYLGAMLPALESVDDTSRTLRDLSALAQDVRRSAEEARRAAELIGPLERTLARLADTRGQDFTEERNGRRSAGIGKLFRG